MGINTQQMEIACANYFGTRQNIIVPNIYWSLFNHECDLIIMTGSGYVTEIEIKISANDLKKDREKWHKHNHKDINSLWFAMPEKLLKYRTYIPARAGILIAKESDCEPGIYMQTIKGAKKEGKPKNDDFRLKLLRLSSMRIWTLKQKILKLQEKNKEAEK